jgi:hypothetical protein
MGASQAAAPRQSKKNFFSFLAWWKTDPAEIERQVANYETLKLWQSARGISLLLCLFTVTLTLLLGKLLKLSGGVMLGEAIVWAALGVLMYWGQRWAFVVAMVLWSFEKAALLLQGSAAGGLPFTQIIFWAIYMSAFMLGLRVERARRSAGPAGGIVTGSERPRSAGAASRQTYRIR